MQKCAVPQAIVTIPIYQQIHRCVSIKKKYIKLNNIFFIKTVEAENLKQIFYFQARKERQKIHVLQRICELNFFLPRLGKIEEIVKVEPRERESFRTTWKGGKVF